MRCFKRRHVGDAAFFPAFVRAFGIERLGAFGAVTVNGNAFEPHFPGLNVSIANVLDSASFGMLTVLEIAPLMNGCAAAIILR